ncbi:HD-GYP domain-containing protein [Paenibacillus aestuarii]|uniref:HD-GYP domain-containing protein n=1 Tax=Paenibacillus aestuarii TaxID=516965 RepID=A0ABW0KHB5_9BACL|nr:HD-GYP domain-containing protein [Paenibacillus aestuarii]
MRIHVLELNIGDKLASDTYNHSGLHLLSAGTIVDAGDITTLARHQVDYVDIVPRQAERVEEDETFHYQITSEQTHSFHAANQAIKALFQSAALNESISSEVVESAFNDVMQNFKDEKDIVSLLLCLNNQDEYTYQHSVQVGMLSYYLATWLGKPEKEARIIGKAGYLHDIGKSKVDPEILKKPGKLTADEFSEVQKHTIYGYEIIRKSLKDDTLALVALQHHERMDGSGYPLKKTETQIHSYASIVAVADIYSAMISDRIYQEKRDLLYVLKELHRMSFGQLDPKLTQVFIRNMIPNFIGKKVLLSDGRKGLIVMTNPSDFFNPLIKINENFVDLSMLKGVEITSIIM